MSGWWGGRAGEQRVHLFGSWDRALVLLELVVEVVRVLFESVRLSLEELVHLLQPAVLEYLSLLSVKLFLTGWGPWCIW